jgi:hypothetical protein
VLSGKDHPAQAARALATFGKTACDVAQAEIAALEERAPSHLAPQCAPRFARKLSRGRSS